MSHPVTVTDTTFKEEVLDSEMPVLVDFWASWCTPCKMIAPIVEEFATQYDGQVKVAKVDVDANPITPGMFGIMSIPTLMIFRGGKAEERIVGYQPKQSLEAKLLAVSRRLNRSAARVARAPRRRGRGSRTPRRRRRVRRAGVRGRERSEQSAATSAGGSKSPSEVGGRRRTLDRRRGDHDLAGEPAQARGHRFDILVAHRCEDRDTTPSCRSTHGPR